MVRGDWTITDCLNLPGHSTNFFFFWNDLSTHNKNTKHEWNINTKSFFLEFYFSTAFLFYSPLYSFLPQARTAAAYKGTWVVVWGREVCLSDNAAAPTRARRSGRAADGAVWAWVRAKLLYLNVGGAGEGGIRLWDSMSLVGGRDWVWGSGGGGGEERITPKNVRNFWFSFYHLSVFC